MMSHCDKPPSSCRKYSSQLMNMLDIWDSYKPHNHRLKAHRLQKRRNSPAKDRRSVCQCGGRHCSCRRCFNLFMNRQNTSNSCMEYMNRMKSFRTQRRRKIQRVDISKRLSDCDLRPSRRCMSRQRLRYTPCTLDMCTQHMSTWKRHQQQMGRRIRISGTHTNPLFC